MPKYGFDDAELAKLFADAGAAVNKAKAPEPKVEETEMKQSEPSSVASISLDAPLSAPTAAPKQAVSAPVGKIVQVVSGLLEEDAVNLNTPEGSSAKITFSSVKSLALGRVESEQIFAWVSQGRLYFMSDKSINLKGMIPKMAFTAIENWRSFISMMVEKTSLNADAGIQAVVSGGGLIPKYNTKDDFFNYLKNL